MCEQAAGQYTGPALTCTSSPQSILSSYEIMFFTSYGVRGICFVSGSVRGHLNTQQVKFNHRL